MRNHLGFNLLLYPDLKRVCTEIRIISSDVRRSLLTAVLNIVNTTVRTINYNIVCSLNCISDNSTDCSKDY